MIKRAEVILLYLLIMTFGFNQGSSAASIANIKSFKSDANLSEKQLRPIFLYVSAIGCPYCKRLEKDILGPMLKSGEYGNRLLLRKILWEGTDILFDFDGKEILAEDFLLKYHIMATPTILFLDKNGNEIAKRITGYKSPDLYWYYLDGSVDKAVEVLRKGRLR